MSQIQNEDIEIDLISMCKYILSKWVAIVLVTVICGGIGFGVSSIFSKEQHVSEVRLFVTVPKTSDKVLIRDNANELLVDYMQVIETPQTQQAIAQAAGVEVEEIEKTLDAKQVENARVIALTITTQDNAKTELIRDKSVSTIMDIIGNKLEKTKPIVIDDGSRVETKQSIGAVKAVAVGVVGGFILIIGIFFIKYLIVSIRRSNER